MSLLLADPTFAIRDRNWWLGALQGRVLLATVRTAPWPPRRVTSARCLLDRTFDAASSSSCSAIPVEPVEGSDEALHGADLADVALVIVIVPVEPVEGSDEALHGADLADVDRVYGQAPPVHQDLGRLREHHVPELVERALIGGFPEQRLPEVRRQHCQEVGLHLLVPRRRASGLHVLVHDVLELRDALLDLVETGDRLEVQDLDLAPQSLEPDPLPVVDVAHEDPPRVQAVEHVCAQEHGLGRA